MGKASPSVESELDRRVEALGFELVEAEWAGSKQRPILRIRVDLPDSRPGHGISVDQCAGVSRALESWLDEHPDVPERYVLEVSSPGVERPLVRRGDWERFAGETVVVRLREPLAGHGKRVEGELLEGVGGEDGDAVRLRLASGDVLSISLAAVERANLVYHWD
jgi:ribosome maturation factor RimP